MQKGQNYFILNRSSEYWEINPFRNVDSKYKDQLVGEHKENNNEDTSAVNLNSKYVISLKSEEAFKFRKTVDILLPNNKIENQHNTDSANKDFLYTVDKSNFLYIFYKDLKKIKRILIDKSVLSPDKLVGDIFKPKINEDFIDCGHIDEPTYLQSGKFKIVVSSKNKIYEFPKRSKKE